MKKINTLPHVGTLAAVLACACACESDDATAMGTPTELGPVYAMMTQVYDTDDRTVYLSLSDTVELSELSLDDAREFGGVANFAVVGGRVLVSNGYEPLITEFEIDSGLQWVEGRILATLQEVWK